MPAAARPQHATARRQRKEPTVPDFLQSLSAVWKRIGLLQRALLLAIALACVGTSLLLTKWAAAPHMRLLYEDLAPEEAAKITEKISDRGIAYTLKNGGSSVYVPEEHVYQLRLDMAREGLPTGSRSGYRILEDVPMGMSPRLEEVNLKRALEEELARTIQMIDGVKLARVHLVQPEETVFGSTSEKTSASVALQLSPGRQLSRATIAAITHLVAGSVTALKSENVTVVDSAGKLLTGRSDDALAAGVGTAMEYKQVLEQNLAAKVEDMLAAVLGPGRASVKVNAELDMTKTNSLTESYDPEQKVTQKEEITSESKTEPATGEEGSPTPGSEKSETIKTDYALTKTVKEITELPGQITSLSVSAVVDLSSPAETTAEGEQAAAAAGNEQSATAEQAGVMMSIEDIQALIKNALGLRETDSLEVRSARFYRPAQPPIEKQGNWRFYIDIARHGSLGILAVCALLVLKIFAGAKKKAEQAGEKALPATGKSAGLLPGGGEPAVLRRQIATALKQNPAQARQLFASWLAEDQE